MTEIKTPYDHDPETTAAEYRFVMQHEREVFLEGYRAALVRDVVSVEAISKAIRTSWDTSGSGYNREAQSKAVHALQLKVPMNRDRLVEKLAGLHMGKGKILLTEGAKLIADALLGGSDAGR